MARCTIAIGVAVLTTGAAMGQTAGSGRMLLRGPTTVTPVQRSHNFLGSPSALPRRSLGVNRAPLLLANPVDITPGRATHFGGRGGGHVARGQFQTVSGGFAGGGREFFDGTSLNVRGEVSAGDAEFMLSLGTDAGRHVDKRRHHHRDDTVIVNPWWWGYGYPWGYYGYDRTPYPIDGPVVIYSNMQDPAQAEPEEAVEAEPLTEPQRAALLLRAGDVQGAIDVLRAHLTGASEDAEALRLLGLALIVNEQSTEAAAVMTFAYERDRSMAHRPLSAGNVDGGRRSLRDAVRTAVASANEQNTASTWLLVTVLMQAEGRADRAAVMLDRARKAGLDEQVYLAMKAALGG
jgi:hypothetical protein